MPGPAEVAGEDDDPLLAAVPLGHAQPDDRRAQDVAGVDERGVDARRDLDLLPVADGPELGERRARRPWPCRAARPGRSARCGGWARSSASGSRGQRPPPTAADRLDRGRHVVRASTASAPRRQPARRRPGRPRPRFAVVRLRTSSGWRRSQRASRLANSSWSRPESSSTSVASSIVAGVAWIGPAVAVLDQQRQQAAVVEVGVGQQDRVELGRVERERDPIADRLVGAALEHAAVDRGRGPAR